MALVAVHEKLAFLAPGRQRRVQLLGGRLGRGEQAAEAYRAALELEPTMAERAFIVRRIGELNPARTDAGSVGWPDDHQPDRGS